MSLMRRVALLVHDNGPMTVAQLHRRCKGYTRAQVRKATYNAVQEGWLKSGDQARGGVIGSRPATFHADAPIQSGAPPAALPFPRLSRPVASVWQFAEGLRA